MSFYTMAQIKRANKALGHHFFSPGATRFFGSVVGRTVYGGKYFVTSEQPPYGPRRYTVRVAHETGKIDTVNAPEGFTYYATRAQAIGAIRRLLKAERDAATIA